MRVEADAVGVKECNGVLLGVDGYGRENVRRDGRGDEDQGVWLEGVLLGDERLDGLYLVSTCLERYQGNWIAPL